MQYPDYFPPNCPPAEAEPADGLVMRFVENAPPSQADCVPMLLLDPQRTAARPCQAAGLSVFRDEQDIERMRRRLKGYRRRSVARGQLRPEHGQTQPSPSRNQQSHTTWWVARDVEPWTFFQVFRGPQE